MIEILQASDPQGAFEIWNNYEVFVTALVLVFGVIGLWGRSLSVGAMLGYLAFAHIAIETQTDFFVAILYVTGVLVMVGMGFKLYRAELAGE